MPTDQPQPLPEIQADKEAEGEKKNKLTTPASSKAQGHIRTEQMVMETGSDSRFYWSQLGEKVGSFFHFSWLDCFQLIKQTAFSPYNYVKLLSPKKRFAYGCPPVGLPLLCLACSPGGSFAEQQVVVS